MKKSLIILVIFAIAILTTIPASALEAIFNPSTMFYDTNGEGVLTLWGVPEANGNGLKANPDYGWPTEFAIATWYSTILKAHEMGMVVVVAFDPVTYDIWYVAKPRPL